MIRAIILSATIAALYCLWMDRPKPAVVSQVDYCVVNYPAAAKDAAGKWHFGFAEGFGPCALLDRFEEI